MYMLSIWWKLNWTDSQFDTYGTEVGFPFWRKYIHTTSVRWSKIEFNWISTTKSININYNGTESIWQTTHSRNIQSHSSSFALRIFVIFFVGAVLQYLPKSAIHFLIHKLLLSVVANLCSSTLQSSLIVVCALAFH